MAFLSAWKLILPVPGGQIGLRSAGEELKEAREEERELVFTF